MKNLLTLPLRAIIRQLAEPKEPKKIAVILHVLASGQTLNRFEAEPLGDHVLPNSISDLRKMEVLILDKWETVTGKTGKPCHCKRYAIKQTVNNLERCLWLLRHWGYQSQPQPVPETRKQTEFKEVNP